MSEEHRPQDDDEQDRPHGGKPAAEGGESDAARKAPAAPADDSSPLGDTDQHSDANS
jgi:hypothetical protein